MLALEMCNLVKLGRLYTFAGLPELPGWRQNPKMRASRLKTGTAEIWVGTGASPAATWNYGVKAVPAKKIMTKIFRIMFLLIENIDQSVQDFVSPIKNTDQSFQNIAAQIENNGQDFQNNVLRIENNVQSFQLKLLPDLIIT